MRKALDLQKRNVTRSLPPRCDTGVRGSSEGSAPGVGSISAKISSETSGTWVPESIMRMQNRLKRKSQHNKQKSHSTRNSQKRRNSDRSEVEVKPCEPLSAFRFFCFLFFVFGASAWYRKPPQVYSSVVYTPRHAKTSSHSHPQKQSLGLRHNKALACIPPARSWLLLRVIRIASRAREGCQLVRQTVLFLNLPQKVGTLGTFLVASRKHRPHHSIHLYTPRPDFLSQRPLLIHTTHKNKALASDTTKP